MDAVLLESSNHFQTGAIAHMGKAGVSMAAEIPLENESLLGPVEQSTPFLEFKNSFRSFLGVDLGHAPVVEQFSPAHGVAEVNFPIVLGINVSQSRRDATLRHHRVGFAE